jgi:phosphopantothenoylcysteine decarboxylase / phosphopantothenate---cysteine ligase
MHPSARLRGAKSGHLAGRRIVLGVSGSIAAVEAVRTANELIRHGATVLPVMTPAAASLVTPLAMEYATGHPPVVHLSGAGEHVAWMDGPERADLFLIAPATANTLSKIALGIDDTALTSIATVALGSGVPVVVAPAMHEVMGRHPILQRRLKDLASLGVTIVPPRLEEGKAKMATPEDLAEACIHRLAQGPWVGRRVLVVSGSTAEPVDPVRVLTNRSSGRMGVELAVAAHRAGADVTLWNAWGLVPLPNFVRVERFQTVRDALNLAQKRRIADFDAILVPAALGDFAPRPVRHKLSSDTTPPPLALERLPKVIRALRKRAPKAVVVAFKAESDARQLIARATERRSEYGAQLVVANTAEAFGAERAEVHLVDEARPRRVRGAKAELAEAILEAAARHLDRGSK